MPVFRSKPPADASPNDNTLHPNADDTTNTVMIAIDSSENSEAAVDYYLKKLHRPGNNILFTHSVEHPHFSGGFALANMQSQHADSYRKQFSQESQLLGNDHHDRIALLIVVSETMEEYKRFAKAKAEQVEKLEKKFGDKLVGHNINHQLKTVDYGNKNPGQSICKLAEEVKPAMIVMASRGHGLVTRTILGSVSQYVLHHAASPVLICHHGKYQITNIKREPERDLLLS